MLQHTVTLLCIIFLFTFFSIQHSKVKTDIILENFEYKTPNSIYRKNPPPPLPAPETQKNVQKTQDTGASCVSKFQMPYQLSHPSKCFSCERQMAGTDEMYLAEPGKCFDCENQIIDTLGPSYALYGQSTKCFNCEKQPAVWGTYPGIQ